MPLWTIMLYAFRYEVAVGHDHAFGAARGPAGVVDRDGLVLTDLGAGRRCRGLAAFDELVPVEVQPSRRARLPLSRRPNASTFGRSLRISSTTPVYSQSTRTRRAHAGMIEDVLVIRRDEPVVQRDENDPDLGGRVEALQVEVGVGAEHADPVAALRRPRSRSAFERRFDPLIELAVRVAVLAGHRRSRSSPGYRRTARSRKSVTSMGTSTGTSGGAARGHPERRGPHCGAARDRRV